MSADNTSEANFESSGVKRHDVKAIHKDEECLDGTVHFKHMGCPLFSNPWSTYYKTVAVVRWVQSKAEWILVGV